MQVLVVIFEIVEFHKFGNLKFLFQFQGTKGKIRSHKSKKDRQLNGVRY